MSDINNLVRIKKLRSGDIIFEFTPYISREIIKRAIKWGFKLIFKLFSPVFLFFDKLAEKRKLVISSVGFGIGLGLSIIVTQRPDALQAFPILENRTIAGAEARIIKIPELNLYETIKSGNLTNLSDNIFSDELIHLEGSGFLGQNSPVVVADLGSKNLLKKIEAIKIGAEITVIGKNNGIYRYRVIEIRGIEAEYLTHIIATAENSLIIYKPENLLRTQLFVVIAKPFN